MAVQAPGAAPAASDVVWSVSCVFDGHGGAAAAEFSAAALPPRALAVSAQPHVAHHTHRQPEGRARPREPPPCAAAVCGCSSSPRAIGSPSLSARVRTILHRPDDVGASNTRTKLLALQCGQPPSDRPATVRTTWAPGLALLLWRNAWVTGLIEQARRPTRGHPAQPRTGPSNTRLL